MSLSPNALPEAFTQGVLSPRRARSLAAERPLPFLVDQRQENDAPGGSIPLHSELVLAGVRRRGTVKLVFEGFAKRPVFVAGVVALAAVTGIGLFLGLMLGEIFG